MTAEIEARATAAFRARDYATASALYAELLAAPAAPRIRARRLLQRAICELRTGNPAGGEDLLAEAAGLAPDDGRIRYKYGIALARMGRHGEALVELRAAATLSPDVAEHHHRLAVSLRAHAEEAAAAAALERCLQLQPGHRAARVALDNPPPVEQQAMLLAKFGKSALNAQRFGEAVDYLRRACALDPANAFLADLLQRARRAQAFAAEGGRA